VDGGRLTLGLVLGFGLAAYYRRFVEKFAHIAGHLHALVGKTATDEAGKEGPHWRRMDGTVSRRF
jgi:hypothetical protein